MDGRRGGLLVLREEPAQPVLRLQLASVLAVLPPGALLPPEALLLLGPPPRRLIVLRHVLGALPGPLLSPPANEMLGYGGKRLQFTRKPHPANGMLTTSGRTESSASAKPRLSGPL